jgi:hypothetical protein
MARPAPSAFDETEHLVDETRRFLKPYFEQHTWAADPDGYACDLRAVLEEIENSNMPDWAKSLAYAPILDATKKRRGKPKRASRDMALRLAAERLTARGISPTRNEATTKQASASSIICEALKRLGDPHPPTEKQINAIVLKNPRA